MRWRVQMCAATVLVDLDNVAVRIEKEKLRARSGEP
jgi:hypothetical protein